MKKLLSKFLIAALISATFLVSSPSSTQAGGSLYVSPSGTSVAGGSSFSLYVRVNATSTVDAVQANLSYPAEKLTFLGSYAGSAFEIQAESSGGGGSIRIGRGTLSAKSGDQLVATISFRAIPSSGSATVAFTSGSEAVKGGSVVVSATSGSTITFTEPAPAPKPAPKDKTAPKISNIKVTNIGLTAATVTWKTNEKASSIVEYGPTKKLGLIASSNKLTKTHKVSLSKKLLLAGSKYYYQVKSKDKAGNVAKSKVTSFKTKGYSIKLKILDSQGNPLEKVKVKLIPGLEETTTSETGVAIFTDVAAGEHSVNVTVGDQVLAAQIVVEESTDPETVQDIEVKIAGVAAKKAAEIPDAVYIAIIATLVIFVAGLVWWGRKYCKPIKKS
jgi:hypothetical protein